MLGARAVRRQAVLHMRRGPATDEDSRWSVRCLRACMGSLQRWTEWIQLSVSEESHAYWARSSDLSTGAARFGSCRGRSGLRICGSSVLVTDSVVDSSASRSTVVAFGEIDDRLVANGDVVRSDAGRPASEWDGADSPLHRCESTRLVARFHHRMSVARENDQWSQGDSNP